MLKVSVFASSVAVLSISLAGCDGNKGAPPATTATATATAAATAPAVTATTQASVEPTATAAPKLPEREIAGASQVLVTWKGAELAPKTVTRSKADAKKRADEALAKLKKDNMAFEEVAKKYSDDDASKNIGGALGNFEKNAMPEAFSKATFDMKVGEVSDVVETPRGYHIIKRTR